MHDDAIKVQSDPRCVFSTSLSVVQTLAAGASVIVRPEASAGGIGSEGTTVAVYPGDIVRQIIVQAMPTHSLLAEVFSGGGQGQGRALTTDTPMRIVLSETDYLEPFVLEIRNVSTLAVACAVTIDIVSASRGT